MPEGLCLPPCSPTTIPVALASGWPWRAPLAKSDGVQAPEMVAILLRAYPAAAGVVDMDQNLPLQLALRSPVVCHRTVQSAYPPTPFAHSRVPADDPHDACRC